MTETLHSAKPSELHAPAVLEPVTVGDFEFLAHKLSLDNEERALHGDVVAAALGNQGVQAVLGQLENVGDDDTIHHGLRTGWLYAGMVVKAGLPFRDGVIGTEAAFAHDGGKWLSHIQSAIKSRLTFDEAPELYDDICEHPEETGKLFEKHGLSDNHITIAVNHHKFPRNRRAYGPHRPIVAVPEQSDGYVPHVLALTLMLPPADTYDSISVSTELSGRQYRAGAAAGHYAAMKAVDTLAVPGQFKSLLPQVVAH